MEHRNVSPSGLGPVPVLEPTRGQQPAHEVKPTRVKAAGAVPRGRKEFDDGSVRTLEGKHPGPAIEVDARTERCVVVHVESPRFGLGTFLPAER